MAIIEPSLEVGVPASIAYEIPDKRIAWRSQSGAPNAGVVTFHRLSDARASR